MRTKKVSEGDIENFIHSLSNPDKVSELGKKVINETNKRNELTLPHIFMELIMADHFLSRGYEEVDVEHHLGEYTNPPNLIIDVFARSSLETIGVEVIPGTGSNNGIDPISRETAKTTAKLTIYSRYLDRFSVAIALTYRPFLLEFFVRQANGNNGTEKEYLLAKRLTDRFYKNPPFKIEEFSDARLSSIYLINIGRRMVKQIESNDEYIWQCLQKVTVDNYADIFGS